MSDKVVALIEKVRVRSLELKSDLDQQRTENSRLEGLNAQLRNDLEKFEGTRKVLTSEIERLKADIKLMSEKNIAGSEVRTLTNEQIDELVKEIDYCIAQLRK